MSCAPPLKRRRVVLSEHKHCPFNVDADHQLSVLHARERGGPLVTKADGTRALPPLSADMLRHALSFLTLYDLARLSGTSRRFLHTVWEEDSFGAGQLDIGYETKGLSPLALQSMLTMVRQYAHKIHTVTFPNRLPTYLIDTLAHMLTKATSVTFHEKISAVSTPHVLSLFDRLVSLDLGGSWGVERFLPPVLPHIRRLHAPCGESNLSDILTFSWLPQLSVLHLGLGGGLTAQHLESLAATCQNLEDLQLSIQAQLPLDGIMRWCTRLTPRPLRRLFIEYISDQGELDVSSWLQCLSSLTALRTLHLVSSPDSINDDEEDVLVTRAWSPSALVAIMQAMPELRYLFVDLSTTTVRFVDHMDSAEDLLRGTMDKCRNLEFLHVPLQRSAEEATVAAWRETHPRVGAGSIKRLTGDDDDDDDDDESSTLNCEGDLV